MKNLLILSLFVLGVNCSSSSSLPISRAEHLTLATHGSCITPMGDDVNMERVVFLEGTEVDVSSSRASMRATVDRETLYIETGSGPTAVTRYYELDTAISAESPPDIQLSFVLVGQAHGVYWRETYQHQQYQQGIFQIEGDHISALCAGLGGHTTER